MQELFWDGITKSRTITSDAVRIRHLVVDSAKNGDWRGLLSILADNPNLVNITGPDGEVLYAPIHHAAYSGVPGEVVRELLRLGSFRTLQDAKGDWPVDIARDRSHAHLVGLLDPVFGHRVRAHTLSRIQRNFHEVIRRRAEITESGFRLIEDGFV
jgi:hypothetical protein